MQKLLLTIDKISTFVGQAFSWLIVALTFMITWEVFSRYALDHPHSWAFDVMIMMYGTLFMMAGAYTLAKAGHVRGDVLYGFFEPRTQATIDLILYHPVLHSRRLRADLCRLLLSRPNPGPSTSTPTSRRKARRSIRSRRSCRWPARSCWLQGIVEIIRCVICIQQGEWPSREEDVEEVDVDKLKEMVHVKDEDIAKLDQFVVQQEGTT